VVPEAGALPVMRMALAALALLPGSGRDAEREAAAHDLAVGREHLPLDAIGPGAERRERGREAVGGAVGDGRRQRQRLPARVEKAEAREWLLDPVVEARRELRGRRDGRTGPGGRLEEDRVGEGG